MPSDTTDISSQVAQFYYDTEREVVEGIKNTLAKGTRPADWKLQAAASQQLLSAQSKATMAALGNPVAWTAEVGHVYLGSPEVMDLYNLPIAGKVPSTQQVKAVELVATELATSLEAVNRSVLRRVDDVYAQVVGKAVGLTAAGGSYKTIEQAAQQAMDQFTKQGVGTFVDKAGRNWRLGDYVDMATRTGLAKAQRLGHEAALQESGLELVRVQPGPRPCPICDKWARKVLSLGHQGGVTVEVPSYGPETTTRKVYVDATLSEARRAGYEHPNCRCALRAYIPGVSKKSDLARPPHDAKAYADTQAQRGLERELRDARMDLAGAIDPRNVTAAKRKVAAARDAVRDHATAKGLIRQHDRESIGGRFRPAGLPKAPPAAGSKAAKAAQGPAPSKVANWEDELIANMQPKVPTLTEVKAMASTGDYKTAQTMSVQWYDDAIAKGADPKVAMKTALDTTDAGVVVHKADQALLGKATKPAPAAPKVPPPGEVDPWEKVADSFDIGAAEAKALAAYQEVKDGKGSLAKYKAALQELAEQADEHIDTLAAEMDEVLDMYPTMGQQLLAMYDEVTAAATKAAKATATPATTAAAKAQAVKAYEQVFAAGKHVDDGTMTQAAYDVLQAKSYEAAMAYAKVLPSTPDSMAEFFKALQLEALDALKAKTGAVATGAQEAAQAKAIAALKTQLAKHDDWAAGKVPDDDWLAIGQAAKEAVEDYATIVGKTYDEAKQAVTAAMFGTPKVPVPAATTGTFTPRPVPALGQRGNYAHEVFEDPTMMGTRSAELLGQPVQPAGVGGWGSAEVQALKSYSGSGYSGLNTAVRSGEITGTAAEKVKAMDLAFSRATPTTREFMVTRGIDTPALSDMLRAADAAEGPVGFQDLTGLVGKTLREESYVSTSWYREGGTVYDTAAFRKQTLLRIVVPPGSKGLDLGEVSNYGTAEREWLMPRGVDFEVVHVEYQNPASPTTSSWVRIDVVAHQDGRLPPLEQPTS